MAGLSKNGYIAKTASEIKAELVADLQKYDASFLEQDADIQDNILDTAIIPLAQFEKFLEFIYNGYSSDFANDEFFLRFGEMVGLRPKSAFNAQVMLTFTGKEGDIIPKNTIVTDADGSVEFATSAAIVLGTTAQASVLAYSEATDIYEAGAISVLKSILQDGISVTNAQETLVYVAEESADDYRARVQARFRSARYGGRDYALSCVASLDGVDTRLIAFNGTEISDTDADSGIIYRINGIEAIIGGGDDYEVALALFNSFLETQKLISAPSDGDTTRTVTKTLYVYNNAIEVSFTRPKNVALELKLKIAFFNNLSIADSLTSLTSEAIETYINGLQVGTNVSGWALTQIIIPILEANGIGSETISSLQWQYIIDGATEFTDFDTTNSVAGIESDYYVTLSGYAVEINA